METSSEFEDSVNQARKEIKKLINGDKENLERNDPKVSDTIHERDVKLSVKDKEWLSVVIGKAKGLQRITHALKYMNPDANGTEIFSVGNIYAGENMVGTHVLINQYYFDLTSRINAKTGKANNAAVPKNLARLLKITINGRSLLEDALDDGLGIQALFSGSSQKGVDWIENIASLAEHKYKPTSHSLAKQVYWPLDEGYHLLAPLFPTSLVHQVWATIREDRFSEEAKTAREARRNNLPHPHGYREYPNIIVQNFGGTKPQNISQLNSERHGENYLLPSFSPSWKSKPVNPPLRMDSVFDGAFGRRDRVRSLVRTLRGFLGTVQKVDSNIRIRNKRAELVGYIVDEVLLFADELRDLDKVWTIDEACKLNVNEQCWLNPVRVKTDEAFARVYFRGDWKVAVCERFGNWLNAQLSSDRHKLFLDEHTADQWKNELEMELRMLRSEVDCYE